MCDGLTLGLLPSLQGLQALENAYSSGSTDQPADVHTPMANLCNNDPKGQEDITVVAEQFFETSSGL